MQLMLDYRTVLCQAAIIGSIYTAFRGAGMNGALAGVDLKAGGQTHNALLGRTFLRHFKMVYGGRSGTVTISSP